MPKGSPKSVEQHKKNGTFNVTRHRDRIESRVFNGELAPDPPEELSEVAKRTWRRLVASFPKDQLRDIDWEGVYSVSYYFGEFFEATQELREYESSERPKHLIDKRDRAFREFSSISSRFGMSPADRAKLRMATTQADPADPFEILRKIG